MADRVRIDKQECATAAGNLEKNVAQLRQYIQSDVNATVQGMASWWIGDAYEAFKEDFEKTKQILEERVFQQIDDYIVRLKRAVEAQEAQDTDNSQRIGVNK